MSEFPAAETGANKPRFLGYLLGLLVLDAVVARGGHSNEGLRPRLLAPCRHIGTIADKVGRQGRTCLLDALVSLQLVRLYGLLAAVAADQADGAKELLLDHFQGASAALEGCPLYTTDAAHQHTL